MVVPVATNRLEGTYPIRDFGRYMQGTPKHMAWRDLTRIRLASCTRLHLNFPGGAMVAWRHFRLAPESHTLFSPRQIIRAVVEFGGGGS